MLTALKNVTQKHVCCHIIHVHRTKPSFVIHPHTEPSTESPIILMYQCEKVV